MRHLHELGATMNIKLCRDCKHLRNGNCVHPVNLGAQVPDLVNGGIIHHPKWYGAQYCREDEKACGKEARWFEPAKKEAIV